MSQPSTNYRIISLWHLWTGSWEVRFQFEYANSVSSTYPRVSYGVPQRSGFGPVSFSAIVWRYRLPLGNKTRNGCFSSIVMHLYLWSSTVLISLESSCPSLSTLVTLDLSYKILLMTKLAPSYLKDLIINLEEHFILTIQACLLTSSESKSRMEKQSF